MRGPSWLVGLGTWQAWLPERRAGRLAGVLGALALLAWILHAGPPLWWRERTLGAMEIGPEQGACYLAWLGVAGSDQEGASALSLREDGRLIGPAHCPHAEIRALGRGRFSHWGGELYFSSSDGSDPRSNGRSYVVTYPVRVSRGWCGLLTLGATLLALPRLGQAARWLAGAHPAWACLGVFWLGLAFRLVIGWGGATLVGQVKGMPFSDSAFWHAMASDLALGERTTPAWELWSARRPGYYLLLGCVLALTGDSLPVLRVLQALLGAGAAVLVFDGLRRHSPLSVALAGGLVYALSTTDAELALAPLTECLGSALTALGCWCLLTAIARTEARPSLARVMGGGVALGLSNLVRPLHLAVIPPMGVFLALLMWRRETGARQGRVALAALLTLGAGSAVCLAPWILRQWSVHGIVTLSDNVSEALYAATSKEHGGWDPGVSALTSATTLRERNEFFSRGVREHLRDHPGWYAANAVRWAWAVAGLQAPPGWVWFGLALSLLLLPGPASRRIPAALLTAAVAFCPPASIVLWLAGGALAVVRLHELGIVGLLALGTAASLGLIAVSEERMVYSQVWMTSALAAHLVTWAAARAGATIEVAAVLPAWDDATRRWLRRGAMAASALLIAGAALVVLRNREPSRLRTDVLSPSEARPWLEALRRGPVGAAYARLLPRMVVERTHGVRPGYTASLAAGEDIAHWCPVFQARGQAFTVFATVPPLRHPEEAALTPGLTATFPGIVILPPRSASPLVCVGLVLPRPQSGTSFEAVALAVGDAPESAAWTWPDPPEAARHSAWLCQELGVASGR